MRGAPITVGCDCGRVEYVAYGASWECPDCHRRYNTEQIPAEEYWGIMHEMRRYRLQVLAVSLFMGIGFAIVVATVDARRFLPLALGPDGVLVPDLYAQVATEGPATRPEPPALAADPGVTMNLRTAPLRSDDAIDGAGSSGGRPVLLVTLGVPLLPEASAFAVDSAVEAGQALIVANVSELEPLHMSVILGYDALEELTPEVSRSVRRPAEMARSLGLSVELLRIRTPRPVRAMLDLARERNPGLLVFGPDRTRIRRRRYERAVRALREHGRCLIWLPVGA